MKKKTAKAATKRGVVLESVVGRFLVVSSPKVDDPLKEVTGDIEGTFDTQEKAEAFIREDGRGSFNLDGANEGRNEDWCSAMFICKCVAVRKAIPIVSVRVEVVDAVPTPNPTGLRSPRLGGDKQDQVVGQPELNNKAKRPESEE